MKTKTLALTGALIGLPLAAGAAPTPQDAPRAWLTGDLVGMEVVSTEGDGLGEIEDIVVHPGGDTAYAVLSFGGWFGVGEKFFAMPWGVLRTVEHDTDDPDSERSLVLPLTKEKLRQAPGFDKDAWPEMANANWTRDIDSFYAGSSNPNTRKPIEASARKSLITWKLSDLRGYEVETPSGEALGEIKELAIDTDGRVSFVALELAGKAGKDDRLIAVPWDSLTFSVGGDEGDEKLVTLASPRTKLESAPVILTEKKRRSEMCEPAWAARVYEHFAIEPYWADKRAPESVVGAGN